jgi:hypothetical protein
MDEIWVLGFVGPLHEMGTLEPPPPSHQIFLASFTIPRVCSSTFHSPTPSQHHKSKKKEKIKKLKKTIF